MQLFEMSAERRDTESVINLVQHLNVWSQLDRGSGFSQQKRYKQKFHRKQTTLKRVSSITIHKIRQDEI